MKERSLFDIYIRPTCKWCIKAKQLLVKNSLKFNDCTINNKLLREQLNSKAPGIKTIPQIFKSGKRIGGYNDLLKYLNKSKIH